MLIFPSWSQSALPPVNGASTGEDAEFAELFTSASSEKEPEGPKQRSVIQTKGKCTMKIGSAPAICACGFVSCILLVCINVARADLEGNGIVGDAAHQTVGNSQSRGDFAGGGPLHLYTSQQRHEDGTEKPQRRKKRN
jgi:hypothetical protein